MIDKYQGNHKIFYPHIIILYESNLNIALKIIFNHRPVSISPKLNLILPEQFDNGNKVQANMCVLSETLLFDNLHISSKIVCC